MPLAGLCEGPSDPPCGAWFCRRAALPDCTTPVAERPAALRDHLGECGAPCMAGAAKARPWLPGSFALQRLSLLTLCPCRPRPPPPAPARTTPPTPTPASATATQRPSSPSAARSRCRRGAACLLCSRGAALLRPSRCAAHRCAAHSPTHPPTYSCIHITTVPPTHPPSGTPLTRQNVMTDAKVWLAPLQPQRKHGGKTLKVGGQVGGWLGGWAGRPLDGAAGRIQHALRAWHSCRQARHPCSRLA